MPSRTSESRMANTAGSFFQTRQKPLLKAATLYVVSLGIFHSQLPKTHVWVIAGIFSILMNFVYLTEAYHRQAFLNREVLIASILILASIAGTVVSPIFVIGAIFSHDIWDIAKHQGIGVPFLRWYTLSCFAVDTAYSAALLIYWIK